MIRLSRFLKKVLPYFYNFKTGLIILLLLITVNNIVSGYSLVNKKIRFSANHPSDNVLTPTINLSSVTGGISTCAGSASSSPNIEQFSVNGNNLTSNIIVTAPIGFEISIAINNSFGSTITLSQSGGSVNGTVIYVRSASSDSPGNISGNVILTSTGATNQSLTVTGIVNPLPTVNKVPNQNLINGVSSMAINFTGTGGSFNWVNSNPSIGLYANGTGNITPFTAINSGTTPISATITVTPLRGAFAYIANQRSNSVSVINTATNKVVDTVIVGFEPTGVSISPDGSRVYVTNQNSGSVSVINTSNNSVIATITVGTGPYGICVSPDATKAFVVNLVSNSVSVINTATNSVMSTITGLSGPNAAAVSLDNSKLYITNGVTNTVSVINTINNALLSSIPVQSDPNGLLVSPDGLSLYVANSGSNTVSVINTATNAVTSTIAVGPYPTSLTENPNGNLLYVSNFGSNTVSIINTSTNSGVSTVKVGSSPSGVSITPDGNEVYVANFDNSNVSVINTTTNLVAATIDVQAYPASFGNFISDNTGCSGIPISFTITVNPSPPKSSNATLSGLKLSVGNLSPQFTASTTSYTASVGNATTSIAITPTTSDVNANVTVNGTTVISAQASATIPLNVGSNTITTEVTAQDGVTTETYTIIITRAPSTNAYLSFMKLTGSGTVLTPVFAFKTFAYTANAPYTTTSVTVLPTTYVNTSTMKVNGVTLASGTTSRPIFLNVGSNTINIVVTAQDGVTKETYTITVTRTLSNNAYLSYMKIGGGGAVLSPAFTFKNTSYTASVPNTTASVTVTPTTYVTTSTQKVNGTALASGATSPAIPLSVGSNAINVVVAAQDGVTTLTYTITVTRAPGADNTLYQAVSVETPLTQAQLVDDGLLVHQAVSPNGDGINDFLTIENISNYPDNKLLIVNRNGQLVFESKNYDNSTRVFDGHSNKTGQMQLPGTYFYALDYTVKGITKHKTGFIVLKY